MRIPKPIAFSVHLYRQAWNLSIPPGTESSQKMMIFSAKAATILATFSALSAGAVAGLEAGGIQGMRNVRCFAKGSAICAAGVAGIAIMSVAAIGALFGAILGFAASVSLVAGQHSGSACGNPWCDGDSSFILGAGTVGGAALGATLFVIKPMIYDPLATAYGSFKNE